MQKNEIAREILAYLMDHPDAQDTVEGVVQWWLLERQMRYQVPLVKDALAELVKNGLVLEHKSKDSRVYYQANRGRLNEIPAMLKR